MRISPRWIALAVAVSLSPSAFAQIGASSAAVPGTLPSGRAALKPVGEPVEAETWLRLLRYALNYGTPRPPSGKDGSSSYSLEDKFEEDGVKWTMSLDVYGKKIDKKNFAPDMVSFNAIQRRDTAAGTRIESDTYVTDHEGRIIDVSHQTATRGLDGKLVTLPAVTLDRADPKVTKMYADLVGYWAR